MNLIENNRATQLLMPKEPLVVQIQHLQESYFLVLSKEKVETVKKYDGEVHCRLSGDEKYIHDVMEGKMKLQEAIRDEQIDIDCNYRTMLMLESIFWLIYNNR
jgi:ubiquinone biosynthesis protein UbiJ